MTDTEPHMRTETFGRVVYKYKIEWLYLSRDHRMRRVAPQFAGPKVGNFEAVVPQQRIGILLAIGATFDTIHSRRAWEMICVVTHMVKTLRNGDLRTGKVESGIGHEPTLAGRLVTGDTAMLKLR